MITDLRFIERDGKRILQFAEDHGHNCSLDWRDVPLHKAEPEVTITRTQFWKTAQECFDFQVSDGNIGAMVNYQGTRIPPIAQLSQLAKRLGLGDEK